MYQPEYPSAKERSRHAVRRYVFSFLVIAVFAVGVVIGRSTDAPAEAGTLRLSFAQQCPVKNSARTAGLSYSVDFKQFWDVWSRIQEKSVKRPIDDMKLFQGAMSGLVDALEDPYSVYFTPQIAQQFTEELAGSFSGIGAEVGAKEGRIVIVTPLPDSPAERAGVRAGDFVLAINDENTLGLAVDEAVKRIRGPQGSSVSLQLERASAKQTLTIKITREKIELKSVSAQMLPNNIALLTVTNFNEQTAHQFEQAILMIQERGARGIILDLRNNPGGFFETSVAFASEWLASDVPVVAERGSTNIQTPRHEVLSTGFHRLRGIPTVVLVNEGSASASEIVAGALQDYGAATLIGTKTFGKGSVQEYEELPDGSAVKLTIALWYTPKDRSINVNGITPDVVLDEKSVSEGESVYRRKDPLKDPFIQKALSHLSTARAPTP